MVGINTDMPKNCLGCSTKCDPENRRCNIDGHVFEETFSVVTSRRDKDCPLVETEERKTGEWIYEYDNGVSAIYHCSVCGRKLVVLRDDTVENYPYCHCGAKMEVEE